MKCIGRTTVGLWCGAPVPPITRSVISNDPMRSRPAPQGPSVIGGPGGLSHMLVLRHSPPAGRQGLNAGTRGFTLIELMLVILLISLAVAVSYPALTRGSTALRLRASGRDALNTLRYAREKAITQQVGARVVFNRDAQKIVLTDEFGEGERTLELPDDVKIERLYLGGEEIMDGLITIRFLPNGSSESAEIHLRSKNGALLRLVTDPITGGARIVTEAAEKSR